MMNKVAHGLQDVIAVETRLSEVDGQSGRLTIAGERVEVLARTMRFEALAGLLWTGERPEDVDALAQEMSQARLHAFTRLRAQPVLDDPMEHLRAAVAGMQAAPELWATAVSVLGALPVAAALWWHARQGTDCPSPDPSLSHAHDTYAMLLGHAPDPIRGRALERYLVTVSDHGMNASTFTARVIASTQADLVSAITGALGALKGPLHGGAPGPVLDMLDAIAEPERAEAWLAAELDAGRRIMGMGHRVYQVRDPRAAVFEEALQGLETPRLALATATERAAQRLLSERYPERSLRANVEFYTAILLEAVGIPRELFTPMFAVGRAAGWCAHIREQREGGRLLRPRSRYIGPHPG